MRAESAIFDLFLPHARRRSEALLVYKQYATSLRQKKERHRRSFLRLEEMRSSELSEVRASGVRY